MAASLLSPVPSFLKTNRTRVPGTTAYASAAIRRDASRLVAGSVSAAAGANGRWSARLGHRCLRPRRAAIVAGRRRFLARYYQHRQADSPLPPRFQPALDCQELMTSSYSSPEPTGSISGARNLAERTRQVNEKSGSWSRRSGSGHGRSG